MNIPRSRTTVSVNKTTKARMDKWRAPASAMMVFLYELCRFGGANTMVSKKKIQ
jgi:hypothetical protein